MPKLPKKFVKFTERYPKVADAYTKLGLAVHGSGPLNDKTRALVKVAISIAAKLEGGTHAHVRKALDVGARKDELYHVALLSIPTIGFPSAMAAMSWIDDVVVGRSKR